MITKNESNYLSLLPLITQSPFEYIIKNRMFAKYYFTKV